MTFSPCLIRSSTPSGDARFVLGDPLVDRYLEFVAGRSRPNTLLAVAFDLKTFFTVIGKDPVDVVAADVFEFLAHQRDRTTPWSIPEHASQNDDAGGVSDRRVEDALSRPRRSPYGPGAAT